MGTLNNLITIVAIAMKKGESLEPLIEKYGNENNKKIIIDFLKKDNWDSKIFFQVINNNKNIIDILSDNNNICNLNN